MDSTGRTDSTDLPEQKVPQPEMERQTMTDDDIVAVIEEHGTDIRRIAVTCERAHVGLWRFGLVYLRHVLWADRWRFLRLSLFGAIAGAVLAVIEMTGR